jgi:gliding motility-associated-like protein
MPANQGSTVACAANIVAPTVPVVTDNCGTTLTASTPVISTTPTCEGDVTYTYTFTDCEGTTHDWVYTYTLDDNIAPTGTAPGNLTFQCIAEVPVANITSVTDESDNCSGSVVVTVADVNNGGTGCSSNPYVVTRTYTLTDCAGNVTNLVQTITVQDTTAPVITSTVGSLDVTLECSDATAISNALASVPVATDNCSVSPEINLISDTTTVSSVCANTFIRTRTWNFTDACGNLSSDFTQIITIQDDTKPNFTGQLPQDLTLECHQNVPNAAILNATDNCNGIVTIDFEEETVPGSCPSNSTILRTWTATDECGNFETHSQTITIEDNTPPSFDQEIRTPEIYTKCDAIPAPQEFIAVDLCGTATVSYNEVNIEGDCTNKYRIERTWRATDSCGNFREVTQTVYLACDIEVFNAVSPDGDGLNDVFKIEGLECYPNNTVEIYNRWGVKVYETSSYDNFDNSFKGFSDGRTTMSRSEKLPTGTYWYVLKYVYDLYGMDQENKQKIGHLYIQND